jgi:hypothetical protein
MMEEDSSPLQGSASGTKYPQSSMKTITILTVSTSFFKGNHSALTVLDDPFRKSVDVHAISPDKTH